MRRSVELKLKFLGSFVRSEAYPPLPAQVTRLPRNGRGARYVYAFVLFINRRPTLTATMSNKAIMTGKYDMKMLSRLGKVHNRALETFKDKIK
jgi:hypothetical protein